jgi:hypothetical protein
VARISSLKANAARIGLLWVESFVWVGWCLTRFLLSGGDWYPEQDVRADRG